MFVRWKRRKRVSVSGRPPRPWGQQEGDKFLLTAVLVRSERRDGKPRQKVIAYLGSIAEEKVEKTYGRRHFWEDALPRLDALPLTPEQRRGIEAALVAVVPRPTAEEIRQDEQELASILQRIQSRP